MKRLTLAVIMTGLVGSGCANGAGRLGTAPPAPSTTATGSSTPTEAGSPSTPPSPTATPTVTRTITYQVWFARGGKLFATRRTEPFSPAIGRASVEAMLQGPSPAERAAGVGTAVPSGTALRGLTISSGIARVDFSGEFRRAGTTPFTRLQIGQVVYTIGQFSTVKKVVIEVNGGEIFETPQTKAGYEVALPAIVVYSPTIGTAVGSPVTISGTANVFEATVSLRILDENGHEIARGFTTATCGTGCRGDYSTTMSFSVDHDQEGTVEVFESSAKDGSPINVQSIPVTLTA